LGKKGKKKVREIPCNYLSGEKSERGELLFTALMPHISSLNSSMLERDGGRETSTPPSILDVTCGTSPLSDYIINHFTDVRYTGFDMNEKAIELCRSKFPDHVWTSSLSSRFVIDSRYDLVIHIGVSSPRYDVAEIHRRLIENPSGRPALILIEWGDNREGTSDTRETYDTIRVIYIENGYDIVDEGEFDLGDIPYPVRRYEILKEKI
jgi:hypothetical protein